jgi:hypothetical protein
MGMPATGLTGGEVVRTELVGELRTFPLLLDADDLAGIANEFEEHVADVGDRILARGALAGGLVLVLDGQVALRLDGEERAHFGRGEFLDEISAVLDVPVTGDVVALGPVRNLRLARRRYCRSCTPTRRSASVSCRLSRAGSATRAAGMQRRPCGSRTRPGARAAGGTDRCSSSPTRIPPRSRRPRPSWRSSRRSSSRASPASAPVACRGGGGAGLPPGPRPRRIVLRDLRERVKVGRMAGQSSKPRSSPFERVGDLELPSFRGRS